LSGTEQEINVFSKQLVEEMHVLVGARDVENIVQ
jgi:hypothetical protein